MKPLSTAIALLLIFFSSPANAFWGANNSEKEICRSRASKERNSYSAEQTYRNCLKTIRKYLRKQKESKIEYDKRQKCIDNYISNLKKEWSNPNAKYRLDRSFWEHALSLRERELYWKLKEHDCKKATELMSKPRVNVGE